MMSARRSLTLGLLVLFPVGWVAVASCSNDSKPPAAAEIDSGTPPGSDGSTKTDGAPGNDGGPTTDATTNDGGDSGGGDGATGCNASAAAGPVLNETALAGLPPTAMGGQIFPGEYWLTERDFYPEATDPPDAGSARANIVAQSSYFLGATSIDIVEGEGPLGATTVVTTNRSGTYKLGSATELTINQSCPGAMRVNVPFTVSGDELWLFPTRDRRDVYTIQ